MPNQGGVARRAVARVNRAVQEGAAVNPAPQAAIDWIHQANQQVFINADMPWQQPGKLAPAAPQPAPAPSTRATANGRLRSVKLGDILAAYKRTDNLHRDKWAIIDFRPPKVGEFFLGRSFNMEKAAEFDLPVGPRLIIEVVKGKKQLIEDLINDDLEVAMRRPE